MSVMEEETKSIAVDAIISKYHGDNFLHKCVCGREYFCESITICAFDRDVPVCSQCTSINPFKLGWDR